MGRATRWLKGLFGIKNNKQDRHSADNPKRHSISSSCGDFDSVPRNISPVEASWLRSYCLEKERGQQSMHAMAMAAATAAAADAAVAAARAAVEVVKLTGRGRAAVINGRRGDESVAAVKIQTVFRGYLARKALRALKALVKLQALVRGYLVRKQAILTLKSMQALMRAQSTARSRRSNRLIKNLNDHQARSRKSMEMSSGTRDYEPRIRTHNRMMSAPIETSPLMKMRMIPPCSEAIMTVNGVDRHKPASRRKNNTSSVDFISIPYYPTASSPLPFQFSGHLSTASHIDFHQELEDEELPRCSSAQSTPRLGNLNEAGHKFFGQLSGHGFILPSYMTDTQSSKAKLRSLSAPKQRPDVLRRLSLHEMMEISRNSLSGIRMQRSCSQAQEAINFKTAAMAKLDRYE